MFKYNFIYLITNIISGKQYVGKHSTNKLGDGYLGSGLIISQSIKKHGKENFTRRVLQYVKEEQLNEYETFYIDYLNTKSTFGYNLTVGGDGNKNPNKETREKISNSLKEKYVDGEISPWNKGVKMPEEAKSRMSESAKNRPPISDETRAKLKARETWNKGVSPTKETKKKLSDSLKGREVWNKNVPMSAAAKETLSNSLKGKIPWNKDLTCSDDVKKKISETYKKNDYSDKYKNHSKLMKEKYASGEIKVWNKGKVSKMVICPHCGKEGGDGAMTRFHFENCKFKKEITS